MPQRTGLEEWTNVDCFGVHIMEPLSTYLLFSVAAIFGLIGVAGLTVLLVLFGEAFFMFYKRFFEC
jgi:hypothetical protein